MSEHTKGSWGVEIDGDAAHNNVKVYISAASPELNDGVYIAFVLGPDKEKNARRIVACVNACKGIPNEQLECDQPEFVRIFNERNKLLEALQLIASERREDAATWMRGVARSAIAEVEAAK